MATAPTAPGETLGVRLLDRRDDQIRDHSPGGQRGAVAERSAVHRWQDRAFLSVIAAVQLAWLVALGFGTYYVLS